MFKMGDVFDQILRTWHLDVKDVVCATKTKNSVQSIINTNSAKLIKNSKTHKKVKKHCEIYGSKKSANIVVPQNSAKT